MSLTWMVPFVTLMSSHKKVFKATCILSGFSWSTLPPKTGGLELKKLNLGKVMSHNWRLLNIAVVWTRKRDPQSYLLVRVFNLGLAKNQKASQDL